MMKLINWLHKLVNQQQNTNPIKEEENNSIIFSLSKNKDDPLIKIDLVNMSEEDCKNYANMIFNINFGLYENTIFSLLKKIGKEDIDSGAFTKNLAMYYLFKAKDLETKIKADEDPITNKPVVSPTEFQKYAK